MTGLAAGAGRKFLVRLPPDIPPGVIYLELQHGPFVGGACPALVMPPERAAVAAELLQALRAREGMLKGGWLPAGINLRRLTQLLACALSVIVSPAIHCVCFPGLDHERLLGLGT